MIKKDVFREMNKERQTLDMANKVPNRALSKALN